MDCYKENCDRTSWNVRMSSKEVAVVVLSQNELFLTFFELFSNPYILLDRNLLTISKNDDMTKCHHCYIKKCLFVHFLHTHFSFIRFSLLDFFQHSICFIGIRPDLLILCSPNRDHKLLEYIGTYRIA